MQVFGWVFILGGLFMVAGARFGWYESGILRDMDWFDQIPMAARLGGGIRGGFYALGGFFILVGAALLLWLA